jgi:hypothetical protein
MNRAFLSRAVLLLVLILLLVVPSTQAAEPRTSTSPARSAPSGLTAWDVFSQTWDLLTSVWANNGCGIDPSGRCLPGQGATAETDNGCWIDPNGRCGS